MKLLDMGPAIDKEAHFISTGRFLNLAMQIFLQIKGKLIVVKLLILIEKLEFVTSYHFISHVLSVD